VAEVSFVGQSGATWRYWTDRTLGTPGGFGRVFAAESSDGAPMAVKAVPKERPSGKLDERLLFREVEIGRRIAESGCDMLLPVVDVADAGKFLLFVMSRADEALTDCRPPLDQAVVTSVMMDITVGLQQLHGIPIIHRDLKPGNVLRHDGRWKLADFGIARDQEIGTQDPTFVGWGSTHYMAPELWDRKSPTVKTDLYALGCVGFELLAGRPPYIGDDAEIRNGHLNQAIPEVSSGNAALNNLIVRLLAKYPGQRPQDARAVLERLRRSALPRSPVLDNIARGLGSHAAEKSREEAAEAAARAAKEVREQQIAQAFFDLREIVNDTFEDLQNIEPDVTSQVQTLLAAIDIIRRIIRSTGPERIPGTLPILLSTGDVRLRIDTWFGMLTYQPEPEDTIVLAGAVVITNRNYRTELNAANLVCEQVGDRLGWRVYRFRASGIVPSDKYTFGPYGRTHGLSYEDFFGQWGRHFMLHPAMHVWNMTMTELTTESLLGLFQEAIELRLPDSRTGV
jgi:serine/threonine protein kinase